MNVLANACEFKPSEGSPTKWSSPVIKDTYSVIVRGGVGLSGRRFECLLPAKPRD